jgi:hypothetical protein
MKVQTNFAPREHARTASDDTFDPGLCRVVIEFGIVRVHTDRGIHPSVCLSQPYCSLKSIAVWISSSHRQNHLHANVAGAR